MAILRKSAKIFIIFSLTAAVIIGTVIWRGNEEKPALTHPENIPSGIQAVILPHHLLVENLIEEFYRQLSEKNHYDRVILLSPNHFGYGFQYIQSTDTADDKKIIANLDLTNIQTLFKARAINIEPEFYAREHGITAHLPFINKFLPQARVIPVTIKQTTPEKNLERLVDELLKITDEKTLIIASIDFSHYEAENYALENDKNTMVWLKNLSSAKPENFFEDLKKLATSSKENATEEVGMDSPESLYVTAALLKGLSAVEWSIWARTSSAMLMPGLNPRDNTSHIFGYFTKSGG